MRIIFILLFLLPVIAFQEEQQEKYLYISDKTYYKLNEDKYSMTEMIV